MTKDRASEVRHLKREASAAKSRLMDILSALERAGANRDARTIESIIGRLEAWQNRP